MLWKDQGRSSNIEDRRGFGGRAGMGIGGTVVLLVLSLIFGRDFLSDSGGVVAAVTTERVSWDGLPDSVALDLPPLTVQWLLSPAPARGARR